MGFMNKVKATAEKVGEQAKHGIEQGQEKIKDVKEKRKADGLLRDLGEAVYLDRSGKGTAATSSEIEKLMAELRELEETGTTIGPDGPASPSSPD